MNNHDITILYGYRSEAKPDFPGQTFSSDRIELLYIQEEDPYAPHKNALSAISQIKSPYLIMLDDGDVFSNDFIEQLYVAASDESCAFAMPAFNSPLTPPNEERFSLPQTEDCLIDTVTDPRVFPVELHGLMIRTDRLQKAYAQVQNKCEAEKQAILLLLSEYPVFSYVGSSPVTCAFTRESDHNYYLLSYTKDWYFRPFEEFLLPLLEKTRMQSGQISFLNVEL